MKTILFGAAAAVAVMSAAGVANAQDFTTGYVGASYTTINTGQAATSSTLATDDASVFAARGVASFKLGDGVETQLDGNVSSVDIGYPNSSNVTVWGATAHLFWEDKGGSKFGAQIGYQDTEDRDLFSYGLEGRFAATDSLSFGVAAVWGSLNVPSFPFNPLFQTFNIHTRAYDGEASYFVNDNFRLDVGINSYRVSQDHPQAPVGKDSLISYRIGGEVQMAMMPVAVTFGYTRNQTSHVAGADGDYDAFSIGLRHSFGGSLKDRDRGSSPFHGSDELFGGAFGQASTAVDTECFDSSNVDACDISKSSSST